jgi:hypothetical protein
MRKPHEFADLQTLCGPQFSHEEVAGKVRMLMRDDLDHEVVCTMARDRLMHLIHHLSVALAQLPVWKPITDEIVMKSGKYVVTNNISARTNSGKMSHAWCVELIQKNDDGRFLAFSGWHRIESLTHYFPVPNHDEARAP